MGLKAAFGHRFYAPVSFEALTRGLLWPGGMKLDISGRPDGENCVITRSLVLSEYQHVMDRQTDGRTYCLCLWCILS